jgi:hypothetical protein
MKKYFYFGCVGLIIFEILKVFFILPFPGSQEMESVGVAYVLHTNRWIIRIVLAFLILYGIRDSFSGRIKWLSGLVVIIVGIAIYFFNFMMTAESMFSGAGKITTKQRPENKIPEERLVIGIENNGEAKAYPIAIIAYHHQVIDTVGGKPFMITYCDVCHTGRVYEPFVNGKYETFRLVGMDHFNAMFEDATTKSWWRQSTGEAVTGKLKGQSLKEVESKQMTIGNWYKSYPNGEVMQPVEKFRRMYDSLGMYELGKHTSDLTRTDSVSWKHKSWVVGVRVGKMTKTYDWNDLKKKLVINDTIGKTPIVLALLSDKQTFIAFERPWISSSILNQSLSIAFFTIRNDTLFSDLDSISYDILGRNTKFPKQKLKAVKAYQEFWHSWNYFHPDFRLTSKK